jgi:predicted O-methyltransferase YrrM
MKQISSLQEDSIASSSPSQEGDAAATPRMRALAAAMHSFNAYVATEPRLQPVMLPLRDGLSIIRYSPRLK